MKNRVKVNTEVYTTGMIFVKYLFGFIFTVLYVQLSFLLPQKQVYISPSDF